MRTSVSNSGSAWKISLVTCSPSHNRPWRDEVRLCPAKTQQTSREDSGGGSGVLMPDAVMVDSAESNAINLSGPPPRHLFPIVSPHSQQLWYPRWPPTQAF